jgi:hypothetical protein
MQLSELYLNRYLYKEGQDTATQDSAYVSSNQTTPQSFVSAGAGAVDINTGNVTINGGMITANTIQANAIITGSLIVGTNVAIGTAQDAAGVTTIVGNTVTTGYVNALNITAQYVVASISISSPTITGGTITIGSGDNVFKADSNGIYLGNAVFGSAPFRVSMTGAVNVSDLTIANGGTVSTTGKLRWGNGTKIWEDGSSNMGFNTVGGTMIFYGASQQYVQFSPGSQAIFGVNSPYAPTGIMCVGNFNVGVTGSANVPISRFNGGYVYFSNSGGNSSIYGGNSNRMEYNASNYHYFNIGGNLRMQVSNTGIYIPLGFVNLCQMTGATASGISAQDGSMYYRTDDNTVRVRVAGTWRTLSWT